MNKKLSPKQAVAKLSSFTTKEEIYAFIQANFAGQDSRFERQEMAQIMTGEKHHLVICGLSHLTEYAFKYIQTAPKGAGKDIDFASLVGKSVIRKCGHKGKVDAYANGKLRITLDDGSVRNPADYRFKGIYKLA